MNILLMLRNIKNIFGTKWFEKQYADKIILVFKSQNKILFKKKTYCVCNIRHL